MAKKENQTNFTSGVIDAKLAAREDIVFYYNGLKDARNLLVIPQGGGTARPATQFVRELTRKLEAVSLAGATVTAPQGGTAANAKDDNETSYVTTTNNLSTTNPFVVIHIDAAAPITVTAIDTVNIKLSAGALANEFRWQYSTDDAAWSDFGTSFDLDATDRSRRSRRAAGAVLARYWRLARIGATDLASTVSVGEVRFWSEGSTLSDARLFPFSYSTIPGNQTYMMAVSEKNIDILDGTTYHGSISVPHTSAQMPTLNFTQSQHTMILFHGSVRPWKLFRQGDNDEFDYRGVTFTNTPQFDYGAGTGGVDEVQTLNDGGSFTTGGKITILLEGNRTTTIEYGASRAATATNIQTALRALANTGNGITVADAAGNGFTVTFAGEDGKQEWNEMSVSSIVGNSVWSVSRTTKGREPGEDVMSDTRGWPRCGVFHQASLNIAGIPGVPNAYLKSVIGDYYNFDITLDNAERALMIRADSDQISAIYNIVAGQHLTFFANDGEHYIPTEKIDHESVIKLATGNGSKEGLRAYPVEGAWLYVQGVEDKRNPGKQRATSIQEFIYEETVQRYNSNLVSKLSAHLIKNPVDVSLRKLSSTDESNLYVLINEDGTGVAYTALREDTVNAMMPIGTWPRENDRFLAIGVDKRQRVYFIVERTIDGTARRFIEMWNEDLFLDCGGAVTIQAEEFTATAAQDEFTWTFDNPAEAAAIGVRFNGGRLGAESYAVDLGTKTVTLAPDVAAAVAAGDTVRVAKMVNEVTGLDHLTGETVQTFIDGTEGEDVAVVGGVITLSDYADTEIQYGFAFEVSGELMPLRIPGTETLSDEKVRVINVIVNLYRTIGIEIQANGGRWQEIPLVKTDDDVLDRSAMEMLYTGVTGAYGLLGFAVGAPVKFRRPGPGPFTLLGITREVSL